MNDFDLRNDTRLLFRNDPTADLARLTAGKRVLFVYGGGSVKKNGCYEEVKHAVAQGGGTLYEAGNSSRERSAIEAGIHMALEKQVELIIGAGGASVMDCAKLIAFGAKVRSRLVGLCKRERSLWPAKAPAHLDADLSVQRLRIWPRRRFCRHADR